MKINSLILENITSYAGMKADFPQKISVVLGHNAAGKTTLLDAITYALTKSCDRTDKAGRGAENMIRTGAKDGLIMMQVSSNGAEPIKLARPIPGELAIEGQHGNTTQLQANLCEYLGTDVGALSAALSTTAFIDAKPSDQKGLLFGLLGLSFEKEEIRERILDDLPDVQGLNMLARQMLGAAPVNLFTGEASTFDNLYKHFYQLRRDYKRDLKALGDLPPLRLSDDPLPVAETKAQLNELRGLKAGLETKIATVAENARTRARLMAEIGGLRDRLEDAGDPEAAQVELDKLEADNAAMIAEYTTKTAEYASLNTAIDALENAAETKACPLSPDLIQCAMSKAKRDKLILEMEDKAARLLEETTGLNADIDKFTPKINTLKHEARKPFRLELEAAIEAKEADLAALPDDIDAPDLTADIAALAERIQKGESVLADINREEGARQEREKQQEKRAGLEQTVEVLEALVDVLSPSGLPGKILSQTIGPIEERANARLQELTGGRYSLHLVLDPDFAVIVDHDGVTTDLKRLSSSERFRVGLVLQEAIIHLTGLRFMIVDNLDILDAHNRDLAMDALVAMAPELDQVIVLATIGPGGAHPLNPPIPDVALYLLEDGQLREVE